MVEDQQTETSAYNEAGLQIQRLHNLWLMAENSALHGRIWRWFNILNSIERELSSDIERMKDKDTIKKQLASLKKKLYVDFKLVRKTSFGLTDRRSNPFPAQQTLDKIHKILKGIQEGSGKGAIYREKDDEDFE